MIIRVNEIDFDINNDPIEYQTTDVLIHWVSINLSTGPPEFFRIHRESPDIKNATLLFNDSLKDGDCFSTHAGMLPAKIIIHAVIPSTFEMYERTFFNMSEILKEYGKDNQLNTVSIYFHENDKDNIKFMMKHFSGLNLKTIKIACSNVLTFNKIVKEIKSYRKIKLGKTLDQMFINFMIWTGNIFTKKYRNPKK